MPQIEEPRPGEGHGSTSSRLAAELVEIVPHPRAPQPTSEDFTPARISNQVTAGSGTDPSRRSGGFLAGFNLARREKFVATMLPLLSLYGAPRNFERDCRLPRGRLRVIVRRVGLSLPRRPRPTRKRSPSAVTRRAARRRRRRFGRARQRRGPPGDEHRDREPLGRRRGFRRAVPETRSR